MARSRPKKRLVAEMNVVPYIDVMLVLLVIFMITAPLLNQGVQVELPQANAEPLNAEDSEPLVVSVDAEGQFYLNVGEDPKQAVDSEALQARVAAVLRQQPRKTVLVRGDAQVDYGNVVRAMVLLKGAGAGHVGLVTAPLVEAR